MGADLARQRAALQLASSATRAGFSRDDLPIIVAIGLVEGPYEHSTNDRISTTGEYSVGPWQINLGAGGHGGQITEAEARDYDKAARYAKRLVDADRARGGTGFTDWAGFTSGNYHNAIPEAYQVLGMSGGQGAADALREHYSGANLGPAQGPVYAAGGAVVSAGKALVPDWAESAAKALAHVVSGSFWVNIGLTALAVALLVAGFALYFLKNPTVQRVARAAI